MIRDRIESMSSEGGDDDSPAALLNDDDTSVGKNKRPERENGIGGDSSSINGPHHTALEQMQMEETPKKSSCARCINVNLLPLKILLFVFYGGIGVLSTWLNHSLLSKRFTEKETPLVYGLASLLSIATPFFFGLISDKSAQPKKVLAVSLLLAGLTYPLILTVPTAVSYHYQEKLKWCQETGRNESSCLPYTLNCSSFDAELIMNYPICSEGCGGKLNITHCRHICDGKEVMRSLFSTAGGRKKPKITAETGDTNPEKQKNTSFIETRVLTTPVQIPSGTPEIPDYGEDTDVDVNDPWPHVCINSNTKNRYSTVCKVFDFEMEDIILDVNGITGYTEINGDDKCHYPVHGYLKEKESQPLIFCPSPPGKNCYVTCDLGWDLDKVDQWVCRDDYLQWVVAFSVFLVAHTFGTMFVISAAGLLNSAVVSMVHEHEHGGYLGFQLIYGALGFAIMTPLTAFLFQILQSSDFDPLPWDLEYILGFSIWFIISAIITCMLPYNAEWVPKAGTVCPMLTKWTLRGQNLLFFEVLLMLGCFQGMIDVLSYYQIKAVGGSLLLIGIGAVAAVLPALIFMFRIERVIDYCGYHNVLCIALVVISLQFTGYAYLKNEKMNDVETLVAPEWSFLLKGLDTFSILMVWITALSHTHNSAPRSLVATCQTVIVILYCCIGRGLGGVLTYFGLLYLSKEYLLKTCATLSILFCILFLIIHYWCLKPVPYTKKFHIEKPASQGTTGNYKPLKFISKKDKAEDEVDEL